jgi:hypothetical protein
MPRRQNEDVNQSARQLHQQESDDARLNNTGGRRQRPSQGVVKDKRGDLEPSDNKRAQKDR